MKCSILSIIFSLMCFTIAAQNNINSFALDVNWKFRQADGADWHEAIVPGCVHTDLMRNNLIKDPFIGANEKECQWVEQKDWIYESAPFEVEDSILDRAVVRMRFGGLDTYADVFLNEKLLVNADNAFRSWEIDVRKILKKSGNVLRILFHSPIPIAQEKIKALPYPLPGAAERAVTRKPQFHYGWDWGPRLVTCGITKSIAIIAYNEARFTDIYVDQQKVTEKLAQIKTVFTIHSDKEMNCTIVFEMLRTGEYWSSEVQLKRGMNIVELPFEINYPYRWWCNGQGVANQYEFSVVMKQGKRIIDSRNIKTGFRDVKLVTEKDSIGESFYFSLNDKPVFVKGANYIPLKFFPGKATENDYRKMLQSCKDANINMLRVWGGGVYEEDVFYNLCDEMGIMVWQDFMFACSMYPADSAFVVSLIEEVNEQTIRLRNHPSLALWCGNNENAEGWANWGWQQGLTDHQKFQVWRAYKDVFDLTLKKAVDKNTHTTFWESSPLFGRADKRSLTEGDSHYWGLWHDEEPFEVLVTKVPRFMSEFGMQSFPSDEVLRQMMTKEVLSYQDEGMEVHQKHNRGFKLMDKYMQNWYPKVSHDDLSKYAQMTQVVQAEGIAMGIEAQRRAMPRCMGTMYWQLNDVWPSFSWSGMDYTGKPKLLHNYLQTIYAPQLISCIVEKNELLIYWISDNELAEDSLNLQFAIYDDQHIPDMQNYNPQLQNLYQSTPTLVHLKNGSSIIARIPLSQILGKDSAKDKLIEVNLTFEGAQIPSYRRVQKLVPSSDHFLIPESKKYSVFEPKSKKKKDLMGISFTVLK